MVARFCCAAALLATGLLIAAAAHAQTQSPSVTKYHVAQGPAKLLLVPYQVAELVVPVGGSDRAKETREADLIKTIQETIAPQSWACKGGRGTIDYFPMTMTLVVNQTADVQEQVADLLARLRREQDVEVALEVRLVTVPDGFVERFGVDFNNKAPTPCQPLSDVQVFQFLEGVQGEARADVMQAPKLTLLNGQLAQVDCTDKQSFVTGVEVVQHDGQPLVLPKSEDITTGFRMTACPKISTDRRSVLLNLDIKQTDLASAAVPLCPVTVQLKDDQGKSVPFTQYLQQPKVNTLRIEKTLSIPDGGTVLLGGLKKISEGPNQYGPPVLSKVPYVNRLFKNASPVRETQMVYVLVTPRIIVNDEDETRPPETKAAPSEKEMAEESEPVERSGNELGCSRDKVLRELLKAYDEACAAGQTREAAKLARAAITLDPTCFSRKRP
jgi:type II secretory pathway component GspD/PulD (secretin)